MSKGRATIWVLWSVPIVLVVALIGFLIKLYDKGFIKVVKRPIVASGGVVSTGVPMSFVSLTDWKCDSSHTHCVARGAVVSFTASGLTGLADATLTAGWRVTFRPNSGSQTPVGSGDPVALCATATSDPTSSTPQCSNSLESYVLLQTVGGNVTLSPQGGGALVYADSGCHTVACLQTEAVTVEGQSHTCSNCKIEFQEP